MALDPGLVTKLSPASHLEHRTHQSYGRCEDLLRQPVSKGWAYTRSLIKARGLGETGWLT